MSTGIGQRRAVEIATDTCRRIAALVPIELYDWRESLTAVAKADADLCIALNRLEEHDGSAGYGRLHEDAASAQHTLLMEWGRAAKAWNNRGRPTCP